MIYYFGYYKSKYIQSFNPSGSFNAISFKMDYIIKKIKECGEQINIISSYISEDTGGKPFRKVKVDDLQTDYYLPTIRFKGIFSKLTGVVRHLVALISLILIVKPKEILIIYHNPIFSWMMPIVKILKRPYIVLEVEEIFYINSKLKKRKTLKKQEKRLIDLADAYIVVNDIICDKYLIKDKKHVVIYGGYSSPQLPKKEKEDTIDTTQLLFSGSIDQVRGAHLSIKIADYLSDKYKLHISGSGTQVEVEKLKEEIMHHNKQKNVCNIIYHGQLTNDELDEVAFSCDIGLNLQDINNPFEAVSFPSKISFYLAHGMNVVSTRMSSVMNSKLKDAVVFVDYEPKSIAESIKKINLQNSETNQAVINKLDQELTGEIKWLLEH